MNRSSPIIYYYHARLPGFQENQVPRFLRQVNSLHSRGDCHPGIRQDEYIRVFQVNYDALNEALIIQVFLVSQFSVHARNE